MKVGFSSYPSAKGGELVEEIALAPENDEERAGLEAIWRAFNTRYLRLPMAFYGDYDWPDGGHGAWRLSNARPVLFGSAKDK